MPFERIALERTPRFVAQSLLHVERHFATPKPGAIADDGAIRFVECVDRAAEADAAARQILDWARAGTRFRDIVVLARDINEYAPELDRALREHGIAFFVDRQVSAAYQPLIRAVRAALQLALSDWPADRVLDLLKTGLVGVDADTCDALENYLIAHRVQGRAAWRDEWQFRGSTRQRESSADGEDVAAIAAREDLQAMNAVRRHLVDAMSPLDATLADAVSGTASWCQRLCETLDRLETRDALALRIAASERTGDEQAAPATAAGLDRAR